MTDLVEPLATPPPASTPWVPVWSLNQTQIDLRYQGDYLPGSYTDGDIVVFQGVAYLCVRPTSAAPTPWTPPQQVPGYGTSLPANPVDGQEHVLVDSITAPTYSWRLRYNAASTSPYKWEYLGGTEAWSFVETSENCTSTNWSDLATVGPTFTTPRAGDYLVRGSCALSQGAGAVYSNQISVNGSYWLAAGMTNGAGPGWVAMLSGAVVMTGIAAATLLKMQYAVSANNTSFFSRRMTVSPRRLS